METTLYVILIVSNVIGIIAILGQSRAEGLGSLFGGTGGENYRERRAINKGLMVTTLITCVLTIVLSLVVNKF